MSSHVNLSNLVYSTLLVKFYIQTDLLNLRIARVLLNLRIARVLDYKFLRRSINLL